MVSEVIYGGKVHDDYKRRLMCSLTKSGLKGMEEPFKLLDFFTPPTSSLEALQEYIASMSDVDSASLFGFSLMEEQVYQEKQAT